MSHELIMCIVNTGFTDVVMDAAREKGARGGTVVHARGTANKEEFFRITIQPDKEIVMILVTSEIKDAVLHAIYQSAGLKTAGQGIAFSMPVSNVIGISAPPQAEQAAASDAAVSADASTAENESNDD